MSNLTETLVGKRNQLVLDVLEGKGIRGISLAEVYAIAQRRKRLRMVSSGEMASLNGAAELYFRERLRAVSEEGYESYLALKEGVEVEENTQKVLDVMDESGIKGEFISSKTGLDMRTDHGEIRKALYQVLDRRKKESRRDLERSFEPGRMREQAASFTLDFEELANQTTYGISLRKSLRDCVSKGTPLNFYYYLCLRFRNEEGKLGIHPNLGAFKFKDLYGGTQTRAGDSKEYQIGLVEDLAKATRGLNITHNLLVADFDLVKFGERGVSLFPLAEEYISSVRKRVSGDISVAGNRSFFQRDGKGPVRYEEVLGSIQRNDGAFVSVGEVERTLEGTQEKYSVSLGDWDEGANREYVAHTFARNLLEGLEISRREGNPAVVFFNKRVKLGESFNILTQPKVPIAALPIYKDNVGGIGLA